MGSLFGGFIGPGGTRRILVRFAVGPPSVDTGGAFFGLRWVSPRRVWDSEMALGLSPYHAVIGGHGPLTADWVGPVVDLSCPALPFRQKVGGSRCSAKKNLKF